ncbi:glycosyltransferase family 2 protein [Phyllobacterium myrsinacearum]|uniref:GT2 family glycosyltransferase n=1 Tax=Phyllobacterium myrsinacearum TaxID=28101 RepID=A0A839EKY7_9HYPH|nr:glycosyltransferase family 2 protein [Phyllobacterium myrsinacearum]MBA8878895.1 GT2 family glycosyltransferase [Phyllobacterium myrsinacearum]
MKSVDVVIPNYNYGRYLRGCIDSIRSQPVEELRILVIDNASTDESVAIARELAKTDPRIELLLRAENRGAHASFNDGIDWARSDYFLILCSDDYLAPGALPRALALMETHPDVHLTHGKTLFLAETAFPSGQIAAPPSSAAWAKQDGMAFVETVCRSGRNFISGPTVIVRTAIQKKVGHYKPTLTHTDDLEMWLRFGLHGSVAQTQTIQAVARVHSVNQSASVRTLKQWSIEFEAAFRSFFESDGANLANADILFRHARHALNERAYWSAIAQFCRGEPGARDLLRHAINLRPSTAFLPPFSYLMRRTETSALIGSSMRRLGNRLRTSVLSARSSH